MNDTPSSSNRNVLVVHHDQDRAAGIGDLVERAGTTWTHQVSLPDSTAQDWGVVIVFESILSQLDDAEIKEFRDTLPEHVVLVGLMDISALDSPTLFGAGVDLILFEPLVLADIERSLAFAEAIQSESRTQARDRLRKMTALHELAIASGHRSASQGWLDRLIRAGRQILGSDAIAMWAIDRENDIIRCIGSSGLSEDYIAVAQEKSPALLPVYENLPKDLSTHWLSSDSPSDTFRIIAPEAARDVGICRIAWLPVRDSNRLYGHLSFYFLSEEAFERYDLVLADAFASIVAASLGTFWLQTEIRRSNRLYREHVETSPDGVVVCHPDGTVERSNAAMERIAGRDRYEIIGQSVFEWFLNPGDLPWDEWISLGPDELAETVELWLSRKGGERRRVACYARRVQFPDPRTMHDAENRIQLVVEDITIPARRLVELELFYDLTRLISERGSIPDAYQLVVNRLYDYLNYRFVAIGEVSDQRYIELQTSRTHMTDVTIPIVLDVNEGLCGLAVRDDRSVLERNVKVSSEYYGIDDEIVSELVVIIHAQGKPVGLIDVQTDRTQPLDEGDLQLIESIAAHLGLLIEQVTMQERLERQAMTDPLTGISNRRAFMIHLHALMNDVDAQPAGLLLVELDHFKSINDRFGHLFGDEMLKQVANRLKTVLRENDLLARYGGDEIAMIFHNLSPDDAIDIAERLRSEISSEPFVFNGGSTSLTVSIGIALFPFHGRTPDELIGEADRAMYSAKLQGRNSVHMDLAQAN